MHRSATLTPQKGESLGRRLRLAGVVLLMHLAFPAAARAQTGTTADGFGYSVSNSQATITTYNGIGGAATIPATITDNSVTYPVTAIGAGAFLDAPTLTSVTIPASVTSIGQDAFEGCSNATNAVFLGSAPTMGTGVFINDAASFIVSYSDGATGFTSPTWTDNSGDTYPAETVNPPFTTSIANSQITITGYTGSGGAVIIPPAIVFNNVALPVTTIGAGAFQDDPTLTSVTIPGSVTSVGAGAFQNCTTLFSALFLGDAPAMGGFVFNGDAGGFTVSYYDGAASFTSPTWTPDANDSYPAVDLGETTPDQFTFTESSGQITITGYTGAGGAVNIPDTINGLPVITIASAAFTSTSLTSVTIPNGVTTIAGGAFVNCTSLITATIPASVTSIGEAPFMGCSSLNSITVSAQNPLYTSVNGVLFDKPQTHLIQYAGSQTSSYTIPNTVNFIGGYAFSSFTNLTSVTIPATLFNIGEYAFLGCTGLTSVTIPAGLTNINQGVFQNCSGLTSVIIPGTLFGIGQSAFQGCAGLTNLTISIGVSGIGQSCFQGCTSLTSVTFPSSVGDIGADAFEGCTRLTSLTIPNTVSRIETGAFSSCTSLASVTIPRGLIILGLGAFEGCTGLSSALFMGPAPEMDGDVFLLTASNFTVYYYSGVVGFSSPTWTPDANDSYPAVNLGTPTVSISVSGSMAFGYVAINAPATNTLTISNPGNAPLTVSSISYPAGFSGDWSSGTVPGGGMQTVNVTFAPTTASVYGGTITVTSNAGSGTGTITASGSGVPAFGTTAIYGSTYAAWQSLAFTSTDLANSAVSGPLANPSGDGMTNLEKYAFGLSPYQKASPSVVAFSSVQQNGHTYPALTYQVPAAGPQTDLLYTLESSTDLVNWSQAPGGFTLFNSSGPTNGWYYYTYYANTLPIDQNPKAFVRLNIQDPAVTQITTISGVYGHNDVSVTVTVAGPANATFYYTVNGGIPTTASSRYTGPLYFENNQPGNQLEVIQVQAYLNGIPYGSVTTATFTLSGHVSGGG